MALPLSINLDISALQAPERAVTAYHSVYAGLYDHFPQVSRRVGSAGFSMIRSRQDSHATADPGIPDVVVRMVVRGGAKGQPASRVDYGDGTKHLMGRAGSIYLAPADAPSHWETEGPHEIILLALPKDRLRRLFASLPADDPLAALYGRDLSDPALSALLARIWEMGTADGPAETLMTDGLIATLVGNLLSLTEQAALPSNEAEPPMDPVRLARVTDQIEADLSGDLSVETLAAIACLSPAHFARRFRAATGQTPHGYVTARRIEAGRRMLAESHLPIGQIAVACGFSSQSHFTTRFRSLLGTTPAAYRSGRRI